MRRDAAERIGWLDPAFFVYSDEVDFCKRLRRRRLDRAVRAGGAGRSTTSAIGGGTVPERRIVELSRNRDRYMRKHHGAAAALAVRWLTAWTYAVRSVLAVAGARPRPAALPPPRDRDAVPAAAARACAEAAADFNRGPRL